MMRRLVLLVLSLAIWTSLALATPDRHCLDCICQASSGCKSNIRCHNSGANQYFCGPYQIGWAYWADAGKPGYNGFSNDFENCLMEKNCAEATVRGYMAKWGVDCNGDGRVDCLDYAAIHKAGAAGCNQQWLLNSKYWNEFRQCYRNQSPSHSSLNRETFNLAPRPVHSTTRRRPYNSIIEIPKPILPSRPVPARASTSTFEIPNDSSFSASYSSSSSRVNYSRSEVEISEDLSSPGTGGIVSFDSPPNKPQPPSLLVPSTNFKPVPSTNFQAAPSTNFQPVSSRVVFSNSNNDRVSSAPARENVLVTTHTVALEAGSTTFTEVVPTDCLQCLCQASTQCNVNKGCDGAYCGPYLLSWGYWADGGQPDGDYATCAKNKQCSERAIQRYMDKWKNDCNRDGKIDCIDFALIHKLGPHGCGKIQALELTDYWGNFTACQSVRRNEIRSYSLEPSSLNNGADNVIISDRLLKPVNTESVESNSVRAPDEAARPLSALRQPISSVNDPRSQPETTSVRITFNNRDIVNTFPSNSRQPSQPSLTEIPQPPSNLNSIIPSPFRSPTRPQPEETLKPILLEERPRRPTRVESAPSTNTNAARFEIVPEDYYSEPRPAEQPSDQEIPAPTINEPEPVPVRAEPSSNKPLDKPVVTRNLTTSSASKQLVPQECLECICHASSRCSSSIGCLNDGTGKFICGPFQVDWEYWTEAGKPGNRADLSNLENFQMCLNTRSCADETVQGYMAKWRQDCNEDGTIDCNDFAAIHVAGPRNCNAQWYLDSKYYSDFRECYDFRR